MPTFRASDGNIVRKGTVLLLKENSKLPAELGNRDNQYTVIRIINDEENDFPIGLRSDKPIAGWHSLNGEVKEGHGYWIHASYLSRYFIVRHDFMQIAGDVVFKKQNLKGKKCKILTSLPTGEYIVELEENVGGMSADGLGKHGHCVVVNPKDLKVITKEKEKGK